MRWHLRRRHRPSPSSGEGLPSSYSDLCWLLAPDSNDQIILAQVRIEAGRILLLGKPISRWYPAEQDVGRVAQIDVRTRDVEVLCVETANTLGLTRLRFATDEKAQAFVAQLIGSYQRDVGETFPPGRLRIHATRQLDEDEV